EAGAADAGANGESAVRAGRKNRRSKCGGRKGESDREWRRRNSLDQNRSGNCRSKRRRISGRSCLERRATSDRTRQGIGSIGNEKDHRGTRHAWIRDVATGVRPIRGRLPLQKNASLRFVF